MQSNWSLILNVLMLIGVLVAIGRLMKARRDNFCPESYQSAQQSAQKSACGAPSFNDDIIAVRKLSTEPSVGMAEQPEYAPKKPSYRTNSSSNKPRLMPQNDLRTEPRAELKPSSKIDPNAAGTAAPASESESSTKKPLSLMLFLVAKEKRQFAGYELLQTVLASGLRFGEGNLFYRHQFPNGQGPVLCGLAAATPTGVFDLQNIGAFSVRGLCLFMHASHNPSIDAERFSLMLETAKQLQEGLDATLLDDQRNLLTEEGLSSYYRRLHIEQSQLEYETY
ncbi:MAG: cell division protein ZipA C-terminal FtsZ-binding domain-containing protein [Legionellales bacterium]